MRTRAILTVLAAVCAAALAVGTATANRLGYNGQFIRVVYNNFTLIAATGTFIDCSVTIERTVHSTTITKTSGSLIGYVTRAAKGTCAGGEMRFNTETMPWHQQYRSFTGTLPNIVAINEATQRLSVEVVGEVFGIRIHCRYTAPSLPVTDTLEARHAIREERFDEATSISSETSGCPSGRVSGVGTVTNTVGGPVVVSLV